MVGPIGGSPFFPSPQSKEHHYKDTLEIILKELQNGQMSPEEAENCLRELLSSMKKDLPQNSPEIQKIETAVNGVIGALQNGQIQAAGQNLGNLIKQLPLGF